MSYPKPYSTNTRMPPPLLAKKKIQNDPKTYEGTIQASHLEGV